jgi:hypothetical protein
VGFDKEILLVSIGCGRLREILDIAGKYPFVAFGTMEREVFESLINRGLGISLSGMPVFFYETG